MGLLDNTGLAYYTNKLKSIFVRSVNGQGPVGDQGNVEITQVPLAENLYNDEIKDSSANYIYRISGGLNDIDTGDAGLISVSGNYNITGRQEENITIESANNINLTCTSIDNFRNKIGSTAGTYVFQYVPATFPNENLENSWSSIGGWRYDNTPIDDLSTEYGLTATGIINKSIIFSASGAAITSVTVNPYTFSTEIAEGLYEFVCVSISEGEGSSVTYKWQLNGEDVSLSTYGIIVTGSYEDNDRITVSYITGTIATNCTVTYQPYINGTYTFSTPQYFSSTGFNQFNKDDPNFYIENVTISIVNGKKTISSQSGSYVCFCKAAYGSPAGYLAYSSHGYLTGIGWCKNIPEEGTILSGSEEVPNTDWEIPATDEFKRKAIMFEEDGYVAVSVTNKSDLCIHIRWDSEEDTIFEEYVEPSVIDFQDLKGTYNNAQSSLPISSYGIPAILHYNTVTEQNEVISDILDLRNKTYTQYIERRENTVSNMNEIKAAHVPYEYTSEWIYYVLNEPKFYLNVVTKNDDNEYEPINYIYEVNDLGTEEFVGTDVTVSTVQRYGENLRNKLKGNVLTISNQTDLNDNQIASIRKNFLNIFYPVGSIYISVNSTHPSTIWGGEWTALQGRFLIGQSSTYTAGSTGGEATHKLTVAEMPSHTHTQNAHNHSMNNIWSNGSGGSNNAYTLSSSADKKLRTRYTTNVTATNNNTGGGGAHNNMPPYLAVYMWKRTK